LARPRPLAPHARAVTAHADAAEIAEPTARLMNQAGMLFFVKALHADAEPLMRRALKIFIGSLGMEHPRSRTVVGNYFALLQAMGRTRTKSRGSLNPCSSGGDGGLTPPENSPLQPAAAARRFVDLLRQFQHLNRSARQVHNGVVGGRSGRATAEIRGLPRSPACQQAARFLQSKLYVRSAEPRLGAVLARRTHRLENLRTRGASCRPVSKHLLRHRTMCRCGNRLVCSAAAAAGRDHDVACDFMAQTYSVSSPFDNCIAG
jgi:hypothetical protein